MKRSSERILTTRDCYPPKELPKSITVVGSGVTGVEFVHMFSSIGSHVALVVSRQQVLPSKDPEVAAVLEDDFLRRGVQLLKGARATSIERDGDEVTVRCDDGRVVRSTHAVLAIGSVPELKVERDGDDVAGGHRLQERGTTFDRRLSFTVNRQLLQPIGDGP